MWSIVDLVLDTPLPECLTESRHKFHLFYPELAENIAPDWGPESYIVVVRLLPLHNSWGQNGSSICKTLVFFSEPPSCTGSKNHLAPRQLVCIMIFIHMMSFLGPHRVQYFLLTQGGFTQGKTQKGIIVLLEYMYQYLVHPCDIVFSFVSDGACYSNWQCYLWLLFPIGMARNTVSQFKWLEVLRWLTTELNYLPRISSFSHFPMP